MLQDIQNAIPLAMISKKFHNTLAEIMVEVARRVAEKRVVLTGGCFQNRILLQGCLNKMAEKSFEVITHSLVPTNDGGISLGQAVCAASRMSK